MQLGKDQQHSSGRAGTVGEAALREAHSGADGRSGGEELPADIKRSVLSPANNPGSFQALQRHSSLTGAALHDNQA